MEEKELRALVSLLHDDDKEVIQHIESKIRSLGQIAIPYLETEWEQSFASPETQLRIEELIHSLHFDSLKVKLPAWKENNSKDLLEGMWLIATYQYPDLSLQKIRADLDQIFYDVWAEMRDDLLPLDKIRIINSVFFGKLRFSPNHKNFHAVSNSMINQVLENKKGNPVSLSVVYMLIAQRLELPIYGVNLPNLFILTYKSEETQIYINPFNRGIVFSKSDIDQYLDNLKLPQLPMFYEPCNHVDIIKRILRNLVVSFEKNGDYVRVEEVKQLLSVVSDEKEEDTYD
jgi:regulator of sirC expression with transglutaminase-like and TPR domain